MGVKHGVNPALGVGSVLTVYDLYDREACPDIVLAFQRLFGDYALLTPENWRTAQRAKMPVAWCTGFLTPAALATYRAACATAWATYDAACATAWATYRAACAPARATYNAACATAWATYDAGATALATFNAACAPARATYDAASAIAYDTYKAACATALYPLLGDALTLPENRV
jgi:hypothetical protein